MNAHSKVWSLRSKLWYAHSKLINNDCIVPLRLMHHFVSPYPRPCSGYFCIVEFLHPTCLFTDLSFRLPVFRRQYTEHLFELGGEVARSDETNTVGDFINREIRLG